MSNTTKSNFFEKGSVNMLMGAFCLATMGAITRKLGKQFSSVELVFFRNIIGTTILTVSFFVKPITRQTGGKFGMLAFRGAIGTLSLFAFYYCLTKLHLAVANTYNLTYPIFIGLISGFILKHKLMPIHWFAILVGFTGVLFVFRPDFSFPLKFHLIGLFTGFGTAVGYITISKLNGFYERRIVVLSFLLTGLILSLISMSIGLFYQNPNLDFILAPFIMPVNSDWIWIFLMGCIALAGQTLITRAFSFGKPNVVGSINFMQIPFAMIYGIVLGDFFVDYLSFIGIVLIVGSGVLMILFSNKIAE